MKTDELLNSLTAKLEPVQPRALWIRLLLSLGLGLPYFVLLFFGFHHRADLSTALHSAEFLLLQGLLIATAILSLVCFVRIQIPGAKIPPAQFFLLLFFAFITICLLAFRFIVPNPDSINMAATVNGLHCATTVAISSGFLSMGLLWLARQQAPTQPLFSGALATLASISFCSIAVDLSCPNNHPLHLLFFHLLLPLLALLATTLPFARKLLRW